MGDIIDLLKMVEDLDERVTELENEKEDKDYLEGSDDEVNEEALGEKTSVEL